MSVAKTADADAPLTPPSLVVHSLMVHMVISSLQQQHGIRPDNDFQAYRQYTVRRLKRLRKGAGFKYGKGRSFVPHELTADDVCATPELLILPLLESERAWAYAMEIKQEMELAKGGHGKLTSHLLARLRKAAHHSASFEKLCGEVPADARTCLEATAYSSWMAGNLHLEQENWQSAHGSYSAALTICQELGTVGGLDEQDLFSTRAEAIAQSLRYCKYNLTGGQGGDVASGSGSGGDDVAAKLSAVVADAKRKNGGSGGGGGGAGERVTWRGRVVPVRTPELRHAVTKAQEQDWELLTALQQGGGGGTGGASTTTAAEGTAAAAAAAAAAKGPSENQFSRVIGGFEDALSAVRKHEHVLDAMVATTGGGAKVEQERLDLALLKGFLGHAKSMRMLTRSRRLVSDLKRKWRAVVAAGGGSPGNGGGGAGASPSSASSGGGGASSSSSSSSSGSSSSARPEDIVHLYGGLKQILEEALKLPGVEDDDELVDELSARLLAVRAQRAYFLAETHTAAGSGKKAVALYDHAAELAESAVESLKACTFDHGSGEEGTSSTSTSSNGTGSGGGGEAFLAAELSELLELRQDVAGAKSRALAQAVLQSPLILAKAVGEAGGGGARGGGGGSEASGGGQRVGAVPLLERLSEFDAGLVEVGVGGGAKAKSSKKLKGKKAKEAAAAASAAAAAAEAGTNVTYKVATVPPSLEAVPCKPMLFNLAHNFIDFPDLDAKAGVKKQAGEAGSGGGGLFGWFRG